MSEEKRFEVVLADDESEYGDGRTLLRVIRNGKVVREQCDRGEPEDNSFGRDWSWVSGAIEQAYAFGVEDGRAMANPQRGWK